MSDGVRFAYVGSRTNRERRAKGEGITIFEVGKDAWRRCGVVDIPDPSFLTFNGDASRLYVAQGDGSEVFAYARDIATGALSLITRRPSHGLNGVHVTVDPTGRFVIITNHLTSPDYVSNLAVFPIQPDGGLGEATDVHAVTGKVGPNRKEQPFAKPHHAVFSPDGRFLAVADKGLDEVLVYTLDDAGKLHQAPTSPTRFRWGCGPRHIAFHPSLPMLYILNELDSTITTTQFDRETGAITPLQVTPSSSDDYSEIHRAAEIAVSPDGRVVYASNRGQDTLGVFAVNAESGRLTPLQFPACGGRVPRHFAISPSGGDLFVANEFSHDVVRFEVRADGSLAQAGQVAQAGSPTCILLA